MVLQPTLHTCIILHCAKSPLEELRVCCLTDSPVILRGFKILFFPKKNFFIYFDLRLLKLLQHYDYSPVVVLWPHNDRTPRCLCTTWQRRGYHCPGRNRIVIVLFHPVCDTVVNWRAPTSNRKLLRMIETQHLFNINNNQIIPKNTSKKININLRSNLINNNW